MSTLCFAYYCSGHGYGHATRVSAFASHLLNLPPERRPIVHICSSAPRHVFAESLALGASYRFAEIDPVIVQPVAYRVDRQKSVEVLKKFLDKKSYILERECSWLVETKADAVLSDAAFLGCLAAKEAGIPSILITNFTFDSVYSYLSTPLFDMPSSPESPPSGHLSLASGVFINLVPDVPVPLSVLDPLVDQLVAGYRCADLLVLLPGNIPIPSFFESPSLPAQDWVVTSTGRFDPEIIRSLSQDPSSRKLHPSTWAFSSLTGRSGLSRSVVRAPLLVRSPTLNPSIYSSEGRTRLLSWIGIPPEFHDKDRTRILIVSFGGQVFRAPSRSGSRTQSRSTTPVPSPINPDFRRASPEINGLLSSTDPFCGEATQVSTPRIANSSHFWVPGAPPASKLVAPLPEFDIPALATIPPSPGPSRTSFDTPSENDEPDSRLLPDSSWIAIVCGVSKDQWLSQDTNGDLGLPEGFYVAPKEVYMPDLTAVGDVLLGKLGYGTTSECVDSCTPFVYVSRPLFLEEHGLRLLLEKEGVGIELSRQAYEAGDWAAAISEAWTRGKDMKARKRAISGAGLDVDVRKTEGLGMAEKVVRWTEDWWSRRRVDQSAGGFSGEVDDTTLYGRDIADCRDGSRQYM